MQECHDAEEDEYETYEEVVAERDELRREVSALRAAVAQAGAILTSVTLVVLMLVVPLGPLNGDRDDDTAQDVAQAAYDFVIDLGV